MGKNHFDLTGVAVDTRPALHGWAPGDYICRCRECEKEYTGDKRSWTCADCAYGFEDKKAKELQSYLRFNLNSEIKVKLTEKGYRRLVELHNEIAIRTRGAIKTVDIEYFKSQADLYGYTAMQAWCFMRDFGDVMYLGSEGYFSLEVLIHDQDLGKGKYDGAVTPDA